MPSRPRPRLPSAVAGGRCHDGMGAISCQIDPGKHRSISRVFHQVSPTTHTQQQNPHNGGRTKDRNHCWPPSPGGPYSPACTHPCGSVKVLSHGSSCLELMFPPTPHRPHTLQHRMEGMACFAAATPTGRLTKPPACLPVVNLPMYLPTLLACVRYLIHPSGACAHDTPSANQKPVPPGRRCDIETRNIKKEVTRENLLIAIEAAVGCGQANSLDLSCPACPAQPDPPPPRETLMLTQHIIHTNLCMLCTTD